MRLSTEKIDQYYRDGFLIISNAIETPQLDQLEKDFLSLVEMWSGKKFQTCHSANFAQFLLENRELERRLYDSVRDYPWLTEFALCKEIVAPVIDIFREPAGLMEKIPFRIDLPNTIRELAVWHQDYRYVRGNTSIITAWIPLQDTSYENGCLMVMPRSHELGIVEHDRDILGKRHYPSYIFHREVRYVEMKRGDLLLFNSLLLHSSGLNISTAARFSVQARYSVISAITDSSMGKLIPL